MKSLIIMLLSVFALSCSTNKASSTNSKNDQSASNVDCTEAIKEYVINNQGLMTNSTESYTVNKISNNNDGTYMVKLNTLKQNAGDEIGTIRHSIISRKFWLDDNCKVVKVK